MMAGLSWWGGGSAVLFTRVFGVFYSLLVIGESLMSMGRTDRAHAGENLLDPNPRRAL